MISVLILTKNEEKNLPKCLASVAWCDDIHVLDSLSTDLTKSIAETAGARVTQREFDDWSTHQNWALRNLPFRYPWVFYLDADEIASPYLQASMLEAVAGPSDVVAFQIQRRDYLMGTWLRHVQTSPFYLRLFQPQKMRYERLVNPISIPEGPTARLSGSLEHFPFSKGFGDWFARHNRYSQLEAEQILMNRRNQAPFSLRSALFDQDFHRRRFHQKELFYRFPARPIVKFLALYVAKRGFLDGRAGFTYAALQAIYEYMIVLKTLELQTADLRER